jgi:cell shape-determining protein MreD
MTRIFLKLLNGPLMIFLTCMAVGIQSALFVSFPLNWIQPDLLILMVIWLSLKRSFTEGGVLTLILGEIAELHSSAPSGSLLIAYMTIYLGVRLASRLVVIPDFHSWIRLTLVSSGVWKATSLLVLAYLDKAESQWRHTLIHLLPSAISTSLLGLWIYPTLDRFDRWTHKNLKMEQRLSDDLKLVENEGL